jgi:hypothetical protein
MLKIVSRRKNPSTGVVVPSNILAQDRDYKSTFVPAENQNRSDATLSTFQ